MSVKQANVQKSKIISPTLRKIKNNTKKTPLAFLFYPNYYLVLLNIPSETLEFAMDSDAADPNWWTSSPKRPREDDEVVKFPLRQEVTAADLEYSTEVAALMAHHQPSEQHPTETSHSQKKKRKIVADQQVYQEEVMTSSSSSNGNNDNVTNTNVPTDEITQVHVDVATTTVPSSSSSIPLPRIEHPPAETTTQSRVHHFLEYTGGSLFTNRHASSTGQPIPTAISAPPIPCSALNPWFLSNGIPNFSKAYQPTPSSSSSGDAKRKLVETEALLHADAAAAYDKHSPSMLHTSKRARLTPSVQGSDVNAAGGGPRPTSGAVVTLVELQDEKRKQTDLETLLVSVITGSRNNITTSS